MVNHYTDNTHAQRERAQTESNHVRGRKTNETQLV